MINSKELRIGNIIYCTTNKLNVIVQWPHPAEVVINVQWPDGGGCEFVHADLQECAPIPLTPEWLERCGFDQIETIQHNQYEVEERYTIRINETNISYGFVTETYGGVEEKRTRVKFSDEMLYLHKEVLFIHQLQNLYFALTGEELTIKQ